MKAPPGLSIMIRVPSRSDKKQTRQKAGLFFGAPAGTRTPDTLLKRQVLYLLSYWGITEWKRSHQIGAQRSGSDLERKREGA